MEPIRNTTEKTQQNPLQINESSYSEILSEQAHNPYLEMRKLLSEVFSLKQTQAENERSKLKHQRRNETANPLLRKQELARNHLLQKMNRTDTVVQVDVILLEKARIIPSVSKKVSSQHVVRNEVLIPTPFIFRVTTGKQKRAISCTENLIFTSTKSSPCETNCEDIYQIRLIREHHGSCLYYIHYKTCEPSFADTPFTVVANPVKNINISIVPNTINR